MVTRGVGVLLQRKSSSCARLDSRGRLSPHVRLGSEFRGAEEVVVAGGIQLQIAHALVVDENVVEIPEIDVGELLGENAVAVRA